MTFWKVKVDFTNEDGDEDFDEFEVEAPSHDMAVNMAHDRLAADHGVEFEDDVIKMDVREA